MTDIEIPHCELERWHYEAVRDCLEYRLAGLVDVYLEEIAMNMPRRDMDAKHNRED